jgi:hypothetical protein
VDVARYAIGRKNNHLFVGSGSRSLPRRPGEDCLGRWDVERRRNAAALRLSGDEMRRLCFYTPNHQSSKNITTAVWGECVDSTAPEPWSLHAKYLRSRHTETAECDPPWLPRRRQRYLCHGSAWILSEHTTTSLKITSRFFSPSQSRCPCFNIRSDPEAQFQELGA